MRRNELVGDDEALRAGAFQRHGLPVVDHLGVALGHQEEVRAVEAFVLDDHAAADQPFGEIDAAGEAVPAGKQESALDALGAADRIERGRDDGVVVLAPDLLLRLRREGRDQHLVVGEDVLQPGLRAAGGREHFAHVAQDVPAHVEAAVARRLAHAQQARALEFVDGFVRHAARSSQAAARSFSTGTSARARAISSSGVGCRSSGTTWRRFVHRTVCTNFAPRRYGSRHGDQDRDASPGASGSPIWRGRTATCAPACCCCRRCTASTSTRTTSRMRWPRQDWRR